VDDAYGEGPQGRGDVAGEDTGQRSAWPPGPGDVAGWRRYLRDAPELEPAWVGTEQDNEAAVALYGKFGGERKGTDLVMFTFRFADEL
jgi:hypothetical protein